MSLYITFTWLKFLETTEELTIFGQWKEIYNISSFISEFTGYKVLYFIKSRLIDSVQVTSVFYPCLSTRNTSLDHLLWFSMLCFYDNLNEILWFWCVTNMNISLILFGLLAVQPYEHDLSGCSHRARRDIEISFAQPCSKRLIQWLM